MNELEQINSSLKDKIDKIDETLNIKKKQTSQDIMVRSKKSQKEKSSQSLKRRIFRTNLKCERKKMTSETKTITLTKVN